VDHVVGELGVSERRACRVLGQHRSTQRKVPQTSDDEAALTADIIALATTMAAMAIVASRRCCAGQAGR